MGGGAHTWATQEGSQRCSSTGALTPFSISGPLNPCVHAYKTDLCHTSHTHLGQPFGGLKVRICYCLRQPAAVAAQHGQQQWLRQLRAEARCAGSIARTPAARQLLLPLHSLLALAIRAATLQQCILRVVTANAILAARRLPQLCGSRRRLPLLLLWRQLLLLVAL